MESKVRRKYGMANQVLPPDLASLQYHRATPTETLSWMPDPMAPIEMVESSSEDGYCRGAEVANYSGGIDGSPISGYDSSVNYIPSNHQVHVASSPMNFETFSPRCNSCGSQQPPSDPGFGDIQAGISDTYGFPQHCSPEILSLCTPEPAPSDYDSPTSNWDPSWDFYHDIIMRCVLDDMRTTSRKLGISMDPMNWSSHDVKRWITETINVQKFDSVNVENFNMPGSALMTLSLDEIAYLAPENAEKLKGCVDVWATASQYHKNYQQQRKSSLPVPMSPAYQESPTATSDWTPSFLSEYSTTPNDSLLDLNSSTSTLQSQSETSTNSHISHLALPIPHHSTRSYSYAGITDFGASRLTPQYIHGSYNDRTISLDSPTTPDSGFATDAESFDDLQLPHVPVIGSHSNLTHHVHLWQFIRQLLDDPNKYGDTVRWISKNMGIFKIENSAKLARLWGNRKNRPAMNYDKLSRSLRQYYKKGILQKTPRSQRLIYQFKHPYNL